MPNNLNENIRKLRLQQGLNQVMLAERLNVTKQCISNWENDNILPSIEALEKLATIFGVTTDFLLGRNEDGYISTDGLTEKQASHIRMLVVDFKKANKAK